MNNEDREKKDREAKERARAHFRCATAVPAQPVSHLDRRIEEKMRGGVSNLRVHEDSKPGAVAMKSRVAAYTRGGKEAPPSVVRVAALVSLDSRIQKKVQQNDKEKQTGTNPLVSLEDRINAKIRQGDNNPPDSVDRMEANSVGDACAASLARLDERIAAKSAQFQSTSENNKRPSTGHGLDLVKRGPSGVSNLAGYASAASARSDDVKKGLSSKSHGASEGVNSVQCHGSDDSPGDVEYANNDNAAEGTAEGLAVATLVVQDESSVAIPAGIEYDPDAKPSLFKNQRIRLYASFGAFFTLLLVIGITVGVLLKNTGGSSESRPGVTDIELLVKSVVGEEKLDDFTSPYTRALRWIQNTDPLRLVPGDPDLLQRYIATYFYYATTTRRPWLSCNPPNETKGENELCDHMKIQSIVPQLTRVPVPGAGRWLSNLTTCEWVGIICDEFGQIRTIDLAGMNMTGPFPAGLQYLAFLQTIGFAYSELTGSLPPDIRNFKHLVNFEVHFNSLTGSLPDEIYYTPNLQRLNVAGNKLSGTISTLISRLRDLKGIYMFDNRFSGQLPTEIGDLKRMSYIRLHRNLLVGTIPTELARLERLNTFWIYENNLSGTIPSELSQASELVDLRVQNNPSLGGELDPGLYDRPDSKFRIDVFNCNMTGTISSVLGQVTRLVYLRLHNNNFSGAFPSNLGRLTNLLELTLYGNSFADAIPQSACQLRKEGQLAKLEADCLPIDGKAPNPCQEGCCTLCCNSFVEECEDYQI